MTEAQTLDVDLPPVSIGVEPDHALTFPSVEQTIASQVGTPEPMTPRLMTPMNPAGAAPREQMGFGENVGGQFRSGTAIGSRLESGELEAARTGGVSQRMGGFADSQLAQLPSRVKARMQANEAARPEADRAMDARAAEDEVFQQAAFDMSQARFTAQSVAGGLVANVLLAPENFISLPTKALAAVSSAITKTLPSASPAINRILTAGIEAGAMNVATDPVVQGARVQSGGQQEFEPLQTALAFPMGVAAGSTLRGAIEAPGMIRDRRASRAADQLMGDTTPTVRPAELPTTPAAVAPEAPRQPVVQAIPDKVVEPQSAAPRQVVESILIGQEPPRLQAHTVSTATGRQVDVAPVVVEASSLRSSSDAGYPADMQPRDRTRAASDAQVREIANSLTPERLGISSEADRGAPIVGRDSVVESGNGRIMAIRQAYADGGEAAVRYRAWVDGLGLDTTGMKEPVVVRQRLTELSPEDRRAFAVEANQAATLSMSAPEKALADAQRLTPDALSLIRSEDFASAGNRDFMRAFSQSLPSSERGAFMAADGAVSSEGVTRARNAVLARAYDDSPVLSRITESADDDTKSISSALVAAAPEWAKLRAEIDAGAVRADMDQTKQLIDAVRRTVDIRSRNSNLDVFLRQQDAFDQVDPAVVGWMEMLYRADRKRAAGKDAIAERIRYYAQEARKASADDGLFGDMPPVRAADLMEAAAKRGNKDAEAGQQGGLFTGKPNGSGAGDAPRIGDAGRQEAGTGGGQAGSEVQSLAPERRSRVQARLERIADPEGVQAARPKPTDAGFVANPDAQFPQRTQLPGEVIGRKPLPADATPDEIHSFRLTDAMRDLAERLGRKVEVDGRFTARGAEGEYKLKDGVIRLKREGDYEVFAHEAGHAIDADLRRKVGDEWAALRDKHADELRVMDANASDPAKQTVDEGLAEFIRSYVTNPAYARNKAPNFAQAFEAFMDAKAPDLRQWFADAARVSQIDSGMAPADAMRSIIVPQHEIGGLKGFIAKAKKEGVPIAIRDLSDAFFTAWTDRGHPLFRFVRELADARYDLTGMPLPQQFTWADPRVLYRKMPAAEQTAVRAMEDGTRSYADPTKFTSPGMNAALRLAYGDLGRMKDPEDYVAKSFSAYLTSRRSLALYRRFEAGDLANPPVRRTRAEVEGAIKELEAEFPQFAKAAEDVLAFSRGMWERKVDAGIISREVDELVRGKDGSSEYVPFYRDMQDVKAGGSPGKGDNLERAGDVKGIKGSTRDILDPVQSIIIDAMRTERQIARNDMIKSLHMLAKSAGELGGRFLEKIPNTELKGQSVDLAEAIRNAARQSGHSKVDAEIAIRSIEDMIGQDTSVTMFKAVDTTTRGERVLFYWDGGERVALKLGNDRYSDAMFRMMDEMGVAEKDIFINTMAKFNAIFAQAITNAPQFALKNLIMDNVSRMFIARNTGLLGRVPAAAIVRGALTYVMDKEFVKAYEAQGGLRGGVAAQVARELTPVHGFAGLSDHQPIAMALKDAGAEIARDPVSGIAHYVIKSPANAIKLISRIVDATETMGRVGQAKIVYGHLRKQGLSEAQAFDGAMHEARDILDYDRFGRSTDSIRKIAPFTNVGIQGITRANANLIGDPIKALMQYKERGDWAKVDPELRGAASDALINWGMIAGGVAVTSYYYASVKDSDSYKRSSDYMRRRYFIIPLGTKDSNGDEMFFTMPKPFDFPGAIMSAAEAGLHWQNTSDPKGTERILKALEDGYMPRQFESPQALLSSMPILKIIGEVATGTRMGFEGSKPMPIVPQSLKALPPEMQYTGNTGWLAKKVGETFGVSPLVVEHVMTGLGATAARDANDLITASLDDNPNMTPQDAWTKLFFGGLYRRQRGVGSAGQALREAMGADGGKYVVAANGYAEMLKQGERANAEVIYNRADNLGKTVMTFRGHDFAPQERQLHPLERSEAIARTISAITRDLGSNEVTVADKSLRRGEERDTIPVQPPVARALTNALNAMASEDIVSGFAVAKLPGYENAPVIDTKARMAAIRNLSPEVADELEKRLKGLHVLPIDTVRSAWPETQKRLLQQREAAKFRDLLPSGTELPRRRR